MPSNLHRARRRNGPPRRSAQAADAVHLEVQLLGLLARDRPEADVKLQRVEELVEERDRALEQLSSIRELEARVAELEQALRQSAERRQQLEATLKTLAEADENS